MRYGVPLLGNRVAPRCTVADAVLLADCSRGRLRSHELVPFQGNGWADLLGLLHLKHVEVLVCGGLRRELKRAASSQRLQVVDNVAGAADDILEAIDTGRLEPGFGLERTAPERGSNAAESGERAADRPARSQPTAPPADGSPVSQPDLADCLACSDRICLRGEPCDQMPEAGRTPLDEGSRQVLEAAMDVGFEVDRKMCRITELIYFCLEMGYRKIGVAFCVDLLEPTEILVRVLRRFFEVLPVCCKAGGTRTVDAALHREQQDAGREREHIACNPLGQAAVLNEAQTDLNLIVGLCIGADCLLARESRAPVTTLFVKDKSLANNPIGALYSEYYMDEVYRAPTPGRRQTTKGAIR